MHCLIAALLVHFRENRELYREFASSFLLSAQFGHVDNYNGAVFLNCCNNSDLLVESVAVAKIFVIF